MSWSCDGRYMTTRNDNMPSTLWVWDAEELTLFSVVVQARDDDFSNALLVL